MDKVKVLIADDHMLFRQGLSQIIDLEEDMEVVKQVSNGQELIDYLEVADYLIDANEKPDVILIDINMPVLDGISAIKKLTEKSIKVKIIVVTFHTEKEYIDETLRLGANGYILKDADSDILIHAIREVYEGKTFVQENINNEYSKTVQNMNIPIADNNTDGLTQREIEVLNLIARGMLNKEIARDLYISEKTVKNHVSNIFKKLDVADRTQAAIYAIKNNLVK
jgi:two-component system response regulator DegU